jgi:hypothetical protein
MIENLQFLLFYCENPRMDFHNKGVLRHPDRNNHYENPRMDFHNKGVLMPPNLDWTFNVKSHRRLFTTVSNICVTSLTLLLLFCPKVLAQTKPQQYYGAYSHTPQGSTRAMGIGGAYTGLSDDAAGIIYNPAGLPFGDWTFDVGSTLNLNINKEVDVNNDKKADGVPLKFQFFSAAVHVGPFVFAAGRSSPFSADIYGNTWNNSTAALRITNDDLLFASKLGSNLAFGITMHQSVLYSDYKSTQYNWQNEVKGKNYTAGIAYRPERNLGFGLSYTPMQKFEVDPAINQNIGYDSLSQEYGWFKGVATPERYTLGGFFKSSDRLTYAADLDVIKPVENSIFVVNPFSNWGYTPGEEIKTQLVQIPHGGIEYKIVNEKRRGFIWRVGGYREPARSAAAEDRLHFTMGVELRLGPISISSSMDECAGFTNSSQSASLVLGD